MRKICLLFLMFLPSCALVFNGTTQDVPVNSYPVGANVYLAGKYVGKSPVTLEVSRNGKESILVEKKGYIPQGITFSRKTHPWYWLGWIFFTGPFELFSLIGGAKNEITPREVFVILEKE